MNDHQTDQVYAWENKYIRPRIKGRVSIKQAKQVVDRILDDKKFCRKRKINHKFLKVKLIESKLRKDLYGQGNLDSITLDLNVPLFVVLHELAHSISMRYDIDEDHGSIFLGVYFKIISIYMNINRFQFVALSRKSNLESISIKW